ncbi:ABC transporter permease [Hydrogenimonas urashimensis]|uniref:ABC transporter permease n=1 Tax=Hydrogenimonas urashimensis TaxID=2740515 RepID=UPI001915AF8B|nr:ABC transporter permease [Hydrogenimonas urashimensis]
MVGFYLHDLTAFLRFYWGRTLFALAGIVLGIASLVFIVAAIEGSQLKAERIIAMLGSDTILIRSSFGSKISFRRIPMKLTMEQYRQIAAIEGIRSVDYFYVKKVTVAHGGISKSLMVEGETLGTLKNFGYEADWGRFFLPVDYTAFKKVIVIGHDIVDEFFDGKNPVGNLLMIGKIPYRIVGVYKRKGKSPHGTSMDERIMMPVSTYRKFVQPEYRKLFAIVAKVGSGADYELVLADVKRVLNRTVKPEDYFLITPEVIKKFLSMLSASLGIFLGVASFTALFVSGFVLSNIFLINNRIRAWEIGLRRALGATRRQILLRILLEASVIAVTGALLGVVAGFLGVRYILPIIDIPRVYPSISFFIGVFFALIVALVAAWSPAKEAAGMDPMEALRRRL